MTTQPIALFSKPGDVRSEVHAMIDAEGRKFGAPIESGVNYLLYLDQAGVTVVMVNAMGRYLARQLRDAPGWRDESSANGIKDP